MLAHALKFKHSSTWLPGPGRDTIQGHIIKWAGKFTWGRIKMKETPEN